MLFWFNWCAAHPQFWVSGDGQDGGGCGVLVSQRSASSGMGGNGYAGPESTRYVSATSTSEGHSAAITVVTTAAGFFVTAKNGRLMGGLARTGAAAGCQRFAHGGSGTTNVTWLADSGAVSENPVILEVATAQPFGRIAFYTIHIDIALTSQRQEPARPPALLIQPLPPAAPLPPSAARPPPPTSPPPTSPLPTSLPSIDSPSGPLTLLPGQTCVSGFVMDRFCLDLGVLFDNVDIETLANPSFHSVHCLVDLQVCHSSGYEILRSPPPSDIPFAINYYTRTVALDAPGNAAVLSLARAVGACDTCARGYSGGAQARGFRATVVGRVQPNTDSAAAGDGFGPPPLIDTTDGGVYLDTALCPSPPSSPPALPPSPSPPPPPLPPPLPSLPPLPLPLLPRPLPDRPVTPLPSRPLPMPPPSLHTAPEPSTSTPVAPRDARNGSLTLDAEAAAAQGGRGHAGVISGSILGTACVIIAALVIVRRTFRAGRVRAPKAAAAAGATALPVTVNLTHANAPGAAPEQIKGTATESAQAHAPTALLESVASISAASSSPASGAGAGGGPDSGDRV